MHYFLFNSKPALVSLILGLLFSIHGNTQDKFPTKPISFIVPLEAGADGDVLARAAMDRVSRILGQPITILNRPGAGSAIGYREIHQAKPDGYTLGIASATIITNKLLIVVSVRPNHPFLGLHNHLDLKIQVVLDQDPLHVEYQY